jgi:subtilisin-like proprotein convertase family protein
VEVMGTAFSTETDSLGNYVFPALPPATYSLAFSYDYYPSMTRTGIVLAAHDTAHVNVVMHVPATVSYTYASPAGNVHIADLDTARKTLDITDDHTIADLDVMINIVHTYDGDLMIWLQSPSGFRVLLASRLGAAGQNYTNTRFDDEAANSISSALPPFTGRFRPTERLSGFDSLSTLGTWTLVVYDAAAGDTGHITDFTLYVTSLTGEAVDNPRITLPSALVFSGNYPNPFNASTQFSFQLAQPAHVRLTLYNTLGEEVAQLLNNAMPAGSHTVAFDGSAFTSGLYFARINAGDLSATRKVILLK